MRAPNTFQRISAEDYRRQLGVEHLTYLDGRPVNSEDDLCIACVRWFDDVIGDKWGMIHIPNGGSRNPIEGAKFKRMGVRAGTPDYLIQKDGVPYGWMEFKWGKNGLTDTQKDFREYCKEFRFAEIRNFDDFIRCLKAWGIYQCQKKATEKETGK